MLTSLVAPLFSLSVSSFTSSSATCISSHQQVNYNRYPMNIQENYTCTCTARANYSLYHRMQTLHTSLYVVAPFSLTFSQTLCEKCRSPLLCCFSPDCREEYDWEPLRRLLTSGSKSNVLALLRVTTGAV